MLNVQPMKAATIWFGFSLFANVFTGLVFAQGLDEKTVAQEKAILAAEHVWLDAVKNSDSNSFQTLLRDDFINLDINGRIQNKVELMKTTDEVASNPKKGESQAWSITGVRVRLYGDVAVLTGAATIGGPKGFGIRFTHIWVKSKDQWLLSTSQATRMAPLATPARPPVKIDRAH